MEAGEGKMRKALRNSPELRSDRFDPEVEARDGSRRQDERDDRARNPSGQPWPEQNDGQ